MLSELLAPSTPAGAWPLSKLSLGESQDSAVFNRFLSSDARDRINFMVSGELGDAPNVPLAGGQIPYGLYSANVTLPGSQYVNLIMDTGSSDLAVTTAQCTYAVDNTGQQLTCPQTFDPSPEEGHSCMASQTFNTTVDAVTQVPCAPACANFDPQTQTCEESFCAMHDCYGDQSGFNGWLYQGTVALNGVSGEVLFGGIVTDYLNFTHQYTAGIFGLSSANGTLGQPPALTSILEQNQKPLAFSMCLGDTPDNDDDPAGWMQLGISGNSASEGYTPTLEGTDYYNVNLEQISLSSSQGSTSAHISVNSSYAPMDGIIGTIVDSGTTEMLLNSETYENFWVEMAELGLLLDANCLEYVGYCCEFSTDPSNIYVDFLFEDYDDDLDSITVSLTLDQMVQSCGNYNGQHIYFPLIADGGGATILGQSFMKNQVVDFDIDNGRVGFTTNAYCNANGLTLLAWVGIGVAILVVVLLAILIPVLVIRSRNNAPMTVTTTTTGTERLLA